MQIKDRPEFKSKTPPFTLHGGDPASTAIKTMAEKNIGSVVIIDDDNKVRGIVTERDLVRKLLAGGLDPKSTPLSQIMTSNVRTAQVTDRVLDWLRLMSNERFRHLPVVDDEGRLINILSQGDFVSYTWPDLLMSVRDKTSETFYGPFAAPPILIGGIMLYTLAVIAVLRMF